MATLAAPRNVSPFIRFCRWGLLLSGVVYGHVHFNRLEKKEAKLQTKYDVIRERRDARLAIEKVENQKIEMNKLAKELGIVPKKTE